MSRPKKIIILGATGGCVDILDTIHDVNLYHPESPYECVGFLDDNQSLWGQEIMGTKVLGPLDIASRYLHECYFVTGIGSPANFWNKEPILTRLDIPISRFETIIHPTSSISSTAKLGNGCVIYQHVTVSRDVEVGHHVLVLPNTVISHGDYIGDYTIINAGVCISGDVNIGKSCYIGQKSAIRQDVTLGDYSQVGIGSTVLQNIPENHVVVGTPAKFLRNTRAKPI